MATKKYQVIFPLVITKKPDGSDLYIYEGGLLPDSTKQEEIDRLLADKAIEAVAADAAADQATAQSN